MRCRILCLCRPKKRCYFSILLGVFVIIKIYETVWPESFKLASKLISFFEDEDCGSTTSKTLVSELCKNYSKKLVFGKLCHPLCIERQIKMKSCILHHSETVIIKAEWNSREIVLKRKNKQFEVKFGDFVDGVTETKDWYVEILEATIINEFQNNLGTFSVDQDKKRQLIRDFLQDDIASMDPLKLKAAGNHPYLKEFLFLTFYRNLTHIPKLYGSCGNLYGTEAVVPLSYYFPELTTRMEWRKRVQFAVSFLELLLEFDQAPLGPLYHCNMKETDFGLTTDFQMKPIDYDMIFTEDSVKSVLSQADCTKDKDCAFWDCLSSCDMKKKRCSEKKLFNNLQTLCNKIFLSYWPTRGLLRGIPDHLKTSLLPILLKCSSDEFGYLNSHDKQYQHLQNQMYELLKRELSGKTTSQERPFWKDNFSRVSFLERQLLKSDLSGKTTFQERDPGKKTSQERPIGKTTSHE